MAHSGSPSQRLQRSPPLSNSGLTLLPARREVTEQLITSEPGLLLKLKLFFSQQL